ncbi:TPA: PTS sugar transporter subunit IIA [Candidatus Poribacteria bacterium]|nr:PTS sugar transporter subunit IIA [Candidatus Poribacteria bacterium]
MIGIIVTTCGKLASDFIETVEMVLGKQELAEAVVVIPQDSADDITSNLKAAVEKLQRSDGVLILTGIFGESCCNFSLSLCRQDDIPLRVVTGVNLPMLFKVFTYRSMLNLDELAERACEGGQEGIFDATERIKVSER